MDIQQPKRIVGNAIQTIGKIVSEVVTKIELDTPKSYFSLMIKDSQGIPSILQAMGTHGLATVIANKYFFDDYIFITGYLGNFTKYMHGLSHSKYRILIKTITKVTEAEFNRQYTQVAKEVATIDDDFLMPSDNSSRVFISNF